MNKKRNMFFKMITASLMRRRSRMVVALLAIAIGATILSGLVTIYYDVPRQMGAQFRNYGANMILTAADGDFTTEEFTQATSRVKANELVGAAPYRYETVRMHEQPIMAAGTDMSQARLTSPYWLVDGEWAAAPLQIMLGAGVADALGLKLADTVTVSYAIEEDARTGVVTENYLDFTVCGIVSTGGSEEDYVYMNMSDLEEITGEANSIDVAEISIASSGEGLNAYIAAINEQVPSVKAQLVKRITASETTVLSKLQALVLLVTVVVLALTMICVATTMTAVVTERRKEIGLRKAIGATDSEIIKEFLGEGMLLGAAGGLLGAFLGFAFAQMVSVQVFSSSISFRPLIVPITILVSIAVTAIACLLPIKSATKVEPALVLKGE